MFCIRGWYNIAYSSESLFYRKRKNVLIKFIGYVGVIIILTITVIYVYFALIIVGNETVSTIALDGEEISLKYTKNNNNVVAENILPRWRINNRWNYL